MTLSDTSWGVLVWFWNIILFLSFQMFHMMYMAMPLKSLRSSFGIVLASCCHHSMMEAKSAGLIWWVMSYFTELRTAETSAAKRQWRQRCILLSGWAWQCASLLALGSYSEQVSRPRICICFSFLPSRPGLCCTSQNDHGTVRGRPTSPSTACLVSITKWWCPGYLVIDGPHLGISTRIQIGRAQWHLRFLPRIEWI